MDLKNWIQQYEKAVTDLFENRILFIGLQGSFARGEADENSDIDVVCILDTVTSDDLKRYRGAIDKLEYREKICGFVSGKEELSGWDRADLFQFYYDTTPVYGTLDSFVPAPGIKEAKRAVLTGACGIYHGVSHNFLHGRSAAALKNLCKSAAFVMRAKLFCETGTFFKTRNELYAAASGLERKILDAGQTLKNTEKLSDSELEAITQALLSWTSRLIQTDAF